MAMFTHSLRFRRFLIEMLEEADDQYLCAFDGSELVGVLPAFSRQGPAGAVLNSLPFFGSHGGVVCAPQRLPEVSRVLLTALSALSQRLGAFSCTVIESPFGRSGDVWANGGFTLQDSRIGQVTPLPTASTNDEAASLLLAQCHGKTRNMIRKFLRSPFGIAHRDDWAALQALHSLHEEGMRRIGGTPKPLRVFETIRRCFTYDADYRVYTATRGREIVAALLLFFHGDTVEYFTPATQEAARQDQPMTGLIFRAMQEAIVERGAKHWNWGGTWPTQEGVYRFKSRWAAVDHPYRYHIRLASDFQRHDWTRTQLLYAYPYFYCFPFSPASLDAS
jgi:hypothetical protein